MKRITSLVLFMLMFAVAAVANIRQPDLPKSKVIDTNLSIRIDSTAKEARLIIPKSQLKQLRAEIEQLDEDSNTAAVQNFNFTRTQTIVSGMFLTLAFVFGGVWFARTKGASKTGKTLAVGAVVFASGAFATIVFANAGPPNVRSITGKIFSQSVHTYKQASGKIKLETSNDSKDVRLIVPDVPAETRVGEE